MAVHPLTLASLKSTKNSVIGNPSAKLAIAQDQAFVQTLVQCINQPKDERISNPKEDIRVEAAHVIASLAYGSDEALASLVRSNALEGLLYALSRLALVDKAVLEPPFLRALKTLTTALADASGSSQYGLRQHTSAIRQEAEEAVDNLFQLDSLDVFLPLLASGPSQVLVYVAQLIASATRDPDQQKAIVLWQPPADRLNESKGKRGWENPDSTTIVTPSRQGGWVIRHLVGVLLRTRDCKLQEAVLLALASLAKDNAPVASALHRVPIDDEGPSVLSSVLGHTKSKNLAVQLAACSCATSIFRGTSVGTSQHPDTSLVLTILHVLNRLISSPGDPIETRTKACFILYHLVQDNAELCLLVYNQRSLNKLAELVKEITPVNAPPDWDEDEPESIACLREGALMAIASLSLSSEEIRRTITDSLDLIPLITTSITHHYVGVRYAACQCVRALSRAIAALRTNIMDSGLGLMVFEIFKKEEEDRRVTATALMVVCNLVNEHSPLRAVCVEQGMLPRLVHLLDTGEPTLRLNALWALKNFVGKSTFGDKQEVVRHLTWERFSRLLSDADAGIQEQTLCIARNITENEPGIELLFQELGPEVVLARLTNALASTEEDVVQQATYLLHHLLNGTPIHLSLILSHSSLLLTHLRSCLAMKDDIRRPAMSCILRIAESASPSLRREMAMADSGGTVATLRRIAEWRKMDHGGHVSGMGGTGTGEKGMVMHYGLDPYDRTMIDQARLTVGLLSDIGEGGFGVDHE
ncbi:armadillo-type protein [Pterulicium gracile]|uniref:Armadillo-type protein n=1 Tax=Pterulicium gracile TaxID=1884261 RepID=A0A5C3QV71_9AGAR|nr:armadillo-type protein [Pterula gracilis]